MTTRKLTPAEALECLRDRRAVDRAELSSTMFYDRWGTFDHAVRSAIAALEEALAQKPTADVDVAKAWAGHVQWMAELEARDKALLERIKAIRPTEPAAPAPSDEEINKALEVLLRTRGGAYAYVPLRLLARRIGVQGVPQ